MNELADMCAGLRITTTVCCRRCGDTIVLTRRPHAAINVVVYGICAPWDTLPLTATRLASASMIRSRRLPAQLYTLLSDPFLWCSVLLCGVWCVSENKQTCRCECRDYNCDSTTIRLRYDTTAIWLRHIACVCFHSTRHRVSYSRPKGEPTLYKSCQRYYKFRVTA